MGMIYPIMIAGFALWLAAMMLTGIAGFLTGLAQGLWRGLRQPEPPEAPTDLTVRGS